MEARSSTAERDSTVLPVLVNLSSFLSVIIPHVISLSVLILLPYLFVLLDIIVSMVLLSHVPLVHLVILLLYQILFVLDYVSLVIIVLRVL